MSKEYITPQMTEVVMKAPSLITQSPTLTINNDDSQYPDDDDDYKDPFSAD
jgi:hypothetical protein